MTEIVHELGEWLENGPVALSAMALLSNTVLVVFMLFKFFGSKKDRSMFENNAIMAMNKLADAINSLEKSNIKMVERFGRVEESIKRLEDRVEDLEETGEIVKPE